MSAATTIPEPSPRVGFTMLTDELLDRLAALNDPDAAMVFLAISRLAFDPSRPFPVSEADIAAKARVTGRTVRNKVPILTAAGLLRRERTFLIDGAWLAESRIKAATGGNLTAVPTEGGSRWVVTRKARDGSGIEQVPVKQGFNAFLVVAETRNAVPVFVPDGGTPFRQ